MPDEWCNCLRNCLMPKRKGTDCTEVRTLKHGDLVEVISETGRTCPITLDVANAKLCDEDPCWYDCSALAAYIFATGNVLFPHNGNEITFDALREIEFLSKTELVHFVESGAADALYRRNEMNANEEKMNDLLEHEICQALEANNTMEALAVLCELKDRNQARGVVMMKKIREHSKQHEDESNSDSG